MIGRTDKGLVLTTGNFTREAKKEAQRAGVPPIDLVDGIDVELVEQVSIKTSWFKNF